MRTAQPISYMQQIFFSRHSLKIPVFLLNTPFFNGAACAEVPSSAFLVLSQ